MTDLVKLGVLSTRPDLADAVKKYAQASQAASTRKSYEFARMYFERWCQANGAQAWPATPETVAAYLSELAEEGLSYSTITVRRAAIATFHRIALRVYPVPTSDPRVRAVMAGIRRTRSGTPQKQRAPLTWDAVPAVVAALDRQPTAFARNKSLLLFGLTTAMRSAEIRNVDRRDLKFYPEGLVVTLHKSKTDQLGKGRLVKVPRLPGHDLCPVAALEAWLEMAKITAGPVFRGVFKGGRRAHEGRISYPTIYRAVRSAVERAGFDPTAFGSHSLRAGYVTSARARGVSWGDIMEQTGHKQLATVLRYDRPVEDDPATWNRLRKPFEEITP